MFTTVDKALVAVVMGLLYILNTFVPGLHLAISPEVVSTLIGVATPVLVWAWPNVPWK